MTNKTKLTLLTICLLALFDCIGIRAAAIPNPSELQGLERQRFETIGPINAADGVDVKIPDGTPVEIELLSQISSQIVMRGDLIDFAVARPVKVNGVTVIQKGALATARVTEVKKAGHWGRGGKIMWELQQVVAVDGSYIPLESAREVSGDGTGILVAGNAVATGVALMKLGVSNVFLPSFVLRWGFRKGDPVTVPAGVRFWASVRGDHPVRSGAPETSNEQR